MTKLLNRPFKAFTVYALLVLVLSVPVYYLVVDHIWLTELDEHNHIVKTRIEERLADRAFSNKELNDIIELWTVLQPGTQLKRAMNVRPDSLYTISREGFEQGLLETDRFRGQSSFIYINGEPYHLVVETNVEEADETLLAIALVTFLFFALLICGFILLNRRIAGSIWRPFWETLEELKRFDLNSQQEVNFPKTNIEEFEDLNAELTRLIDKSTAVFNQQKAFLENASHELQTPLAVLRSKVNMLLQTPELTAEQSQLVNAIENPLSRVSRINKNLLLLAKIENKQFETNEWIDLGALVVESIELLRDYISDKKLTLERTRFDHLVLNCNVTLVEVLLNNLLINAIAHSEENGQIMIKLDGQTLTIQNTGQVPLNSQMIFKRFVVASSEKTSSGLGLAIVKEVCSRYGWTIHYSFVEQRHSFAVTF